VRDAHDDLIVAHTGCDACHTASTVAALTPTRSFCLTCHLPEDDHYPQRECSVCHFLSEPGEYRSHLLEPAAG
jgi:hypothetical protein